MFTSYLLQKNNCQSHKKKQSEAWNFLTILLKYLFLLITSIHIHTQGRMLLRLNMLHVARTWTEYFERSSSS